MMPSLRRVDFEKTCCSRSWMEKNKKKVSFISIRRGNDFIVHQKYHGRMKTSGNDSFYFPSGKYSKKLNYMKRVSPSPPPPPHTHTHTSNNKNSQIQLFFFFFTFKVVEMAQFESGTVKSSIRILVSAFLTFCFEIFRSCPFHPRTLGHLITPSTMKLN